MHGGRIREISEASREGRAGGREALRSLHDALRASLGEEEPDEARVMQLADQIGAAETEKRKQRLRTMLEIRRLLSPEQRAELVKIHAEEEAERPKRHRRSFGPDGEGGGGGRPPR
jgi:Spy/CpxP family protein refolding chaperone